MFHPLGGKLRIQPDDDGISDKTVGVENPVKTVDVFHGFRRIFSDMDEMKIVCGNQSGIHQFHANEGQPVQPEGFAGGIQKDDRVNGRFSRLDQSECFKHFIHGSEASGECHHGVAFRHEVQFSDEKVIKIDEFVAVGHHMVGGLFIRQGDVQAEGALFSRPFIGCLHDARSASGNDHVAVFAGFPGEFPRRFIRRFVIPDAGGAEDGNLADVAVRGENTVGAVHLPPGADQDGKIMVRGGGLGHVDSRFDILLEVAGIVPGGGYFGKLFDGAFQSLVAGIHGHGGGTFLVFTCKIPVVQKIRMLHELV